MSAQILTVTPEGQLSLPANICENLSLQAGDKLVCYASGDVIMLKTLKASLAEEFETAAAEARKWAESVGYKESDVDKIIKRVRQKNRE